MINKDVTCEQPPGPQARWLLGSGCPSRFSLEFLLPMDIGSVAESLWTPPEFNTSERPSLEATLGLESDPGFPENFVRAVKWYVDIST